MIANPMTISLQLFGAPQCHRYQKMRVQALEVAAQLGLAVQLEEVNDSERLSQINPLDLPRLVANGTVIASRNPAKDKVLTEQLCRLI